MNYTGPFKLAFTYAEWLILLKLGRKSCFGVLKGIWRQELEDFCIQSPGKAVLELKVRCPYMPTEIYHCVWDLVDEKKPFKVKPLSDTIIQIPKGVPWPQNMPCCQHFGPATHRFTHGLVPLGLLDAGACLYHRCDEHLGVNARGS